MPKVVDNEMKRQLSLNEMEKGKVGQPISVDNCFKKKKNFISLEN